MERHFWQMRFGGGGGSGNAHKIRHTIQTIGVSLCHRISCLTKIYLLSITSRNTEVDLNYRSLVLWQRFAIFASLRIERRKKWKKTARAKSSFSHSSCTKGNGEWSRNAYERLPAAKKRFSSYVFDTNSLPSMESMLLVREKKCQFNFCRKNDVAVEFCGREWELRLKMIAAVIGGQCVLCGTCASMLFEAST